MEPQERSVATADGRVVQIWVAGPEDAIPLVRHHGTPGSGLPYGPTVRDTLNAGFRFVSYSRPGYGDSSRLEARSVADVAVDIAAILDHLEAERCCTIGGSGGGPHALATGALLPERVLAVAATASVGPYGGPGLDFLDGMGKENVEEFTLALEGRHEELLAFMRRDVDAIASGDINEMFEVMGELLPRVDREVFTPEYAASFIDGVNVAVRHGLWGWFDDDLAFLEPWGFDLAAIAVPVALWQGELDKMVPEAHSAWLAEHVPGARLHRPSGHGHLSLSETLRPEVLADLASAAGLGG